MMNKHGKGKAKPYEIEIKVKFIPFPTEKRRLEAYRAYVKLFLKAKERQLKKKEGQGK